MESVGRESNKAGGQLSEDSANDCNRLQDLDRTRPPNLVSIRMIVSTGKSVGVGWSSCTFQHPWYLDIKVEIYILILTAMPNSTTSCPTILPSPLEKTKILLSVNHIQH